MTRREQQVQARSETGDADFAPQPVRWRILIVLLAAIFMSLIAVSIVNVALPSIQDGLGASESDLQWVLSGYARSEEHTSELQSRGQLVCRLLLDKQTSRCD